MEFFWSLDSVLFEAVGSLEPAASSYEGGALSGTGGASHCETPVFRLTKNLNFLISLER